MNKRARKFKLTEAINDLLPADKKYNLPVEKLVFKWFVTGRVGEGLRLTPEGMRAFDSTQLEYFEYPLIEDAKFGKTFKNIHEFTLKVGKLIDCPFYLGTNSITNESGKTSKQAYIKVYDSKVAMMISLYGGNLLDYVEAMEKKNEWQ